MQWTASGHAAWVLGVLRSNRPYNFTSPPDKRLKLVVSTWRRRLNTKAPTLPPLASEVQTILYDRMHPGMHIRRQLGQP